MVVWKGLWRTHLGLIETPSWCLQWGAEVSRSKPRTGERLFWSWSKPNPSWRQISIVAVTSPFLVKYLLLCVVTMKSIISLWSCCGAFNRVVMPWACTELDTVEDPNGGGDVFPHNIRLTVNPVELQPRRPGSSLWYCSFQILAFTWRSHSLQTLEKECDVSH
jgi:hypothetical protein